MKKIFVIIMIVLMTLAMAACGGGSSDSASYDSGEDAKGSYNGFGEFYMDDQADMDAPAAAEAATEEEYGSADENSSRSSGNVSVGLPSSVDKSKVKLIFTANISVQTLDFDEAVKGLNALVEKFGGYFESASTENGGYYSDDSYKYGNYTVRIPSDKYQSFVNSVSEGMHVVNLNQNTEDIGQMYFDTERRVETLKNKHDRLEELLKKADKMKDIIELESALSDTEYELEQYTSDLNRYDSLVNYSTVYVMIEKVNQYSTGIEEELTFGERLMRSITSGAEDFGWWFENMINWIGYHIIQIVILVVIIILVAKAHIIRKIKNRFGRKKYDYVIKEKDAKDTDNK